MITTTVSDVIADLLALGFTEGAPAHFSVEDVMANLDAYRRLECEACGHSRQDVRPYHRGKQYRLVCVCRSCGNATEV